MPDKPHTAPWKKLHYRLTLYLIVILVFIMPLRTALEHHFLYFPESQQTVTPAFLGLAYEQITFLAEDGVRLNGWLLPGQENAPVVLFCMGNAGNISHRLDTLQLLHDLGVAVFIFNYRGYGKSEGKASETGTYLDIGGAISELHKRGWPAEKIILFGRSLGAAVSLEAALQTRPAGLIMEAAFTSIDAMGKHHYYLLNLLLGWLIDAEYDNLGKISALQSPLLIIHGKKDRICPPSMAEDLFARAPHGTQQLWIAEAEHNNGYVVGGELYRKTLEKVIQEWTGFVKHP